MTDARVARDALGERRGPIERQRREELFGALVGEAEPRLEVHDRLALDAEPEVAGLDDPGVHRSDRDLEDAFALDAAEGEGLALVPEVTARRRVPPQRMIPRGPELVEGEPAQVRVPDRHEADHVVDLALEPTRRERPRGEGGEPRVLGRDGDEHGSARRERDGREGIDEREVARARARVRRGEELAGRAELREPVRQRGNLAGRHTALERVGGARRHAGRPRLDDGPRERVEGNPRHLSRPPRPRSGAAAPP